MKSALVIAASSDLGAAFCERLTRLGWEVVGTYRKSNHHVKRLEKVSWVHCDLCDHDSIEEALTELKRPWDLVLVASGTLEPVGPFEKVSFDEWERSIQVNCMAPLRLLHALLPYRRSNATVLFFAGAGSAGPAPNYSSYAFSKIALIKLVELLDAEMPDTRFAIVGPGWVKTKIHEATLEAKEAGAGENYRKTVEKLSSNECTEVDQVVACLEWIVSHPSQALSGRNFSVVFDPWGNEELVDALAKNPDLYKLRRISLG